MQQRMEWLVIERGMNRLVGDMFGDERETT
jgi:hypothetical protein